MPPRALHPSGIILVDKPAGPTSFAIVAAIRRKTGARTGHAGTLDPFATGLLLLLSGAATRLQPQFVGLPKRYVDRDRPHGAHVDRRPRGRARRRARAARRGRSRGGARRAARRGRASDSGSLGREDRRRARVCAASPRRRRRDARSDDARARAACSTGTRTASRGSSCTSRPGRTSAPSPRRSAGTASRCAARRSARSASTRPIRSGSSRPDDALARLS